MNEQGQPGCKLESSPWELSPYPLDEEGFLEDPGQWDERFAEELASEEGIDELTPIHWEMIQYARRFFEEKGGFPMPPQLARRMGMSVRRIHDFFPKGHLSIHRLAGLPQPKFC